MPTVAYLKKSTNPNKKYMVWVCKNGKSRTIHFGAKGMSDYTKHKDKERMKRYNSRHKKRENWTKSGVMKAGFWSKWLLWNKPTINGSKRNIQQRFGVKIKSGWPSKETKKKLKC